MAWGSGGGGGEEVGGGTETQRMLWGCGMEVFLCGLGRTDRYLYVFVFTHPLSLHLPMVNSYPSFKDQFKCHLLQEAFIRFIASLPPLTSYRKWPLPLVDTCHFPPFLMLLFIYWYMALLQQTVEWRRIRAMSLGLCLLVVVTLSSQHSAQELQWVCQLKCEATTTMWEPREAMSSLGLWGRPGISHYGLDSLHPKMLKSWSPGLWMRPIWKQGLCRLSSQERALGWTPNAYDCLQKRKIWTQVDMPALREKACKDEGRGWSDASTSQGTPHVARKPPEARREAGSRFFLMALEGTSPVHQTLILDVWPPQLRYNKVLLFKPAVCGPLLLQP